MSGKTDGSEIQHTTTMEERPNGRRPHTGPPQIDLDNIRDCWKLRSVTWCLPRMIAPDSGAETWPPDLICQLVRLARNMHNEYKIIRCTLLEVWHLRLARYPESNPDLIAQDVETVYKRMKFLRRRGILGKDAPKLDAFSVPLRWKRQTRADPVETRKGIDKGVQTRLPPPLPSTAQPPHVGESPRTKRNTRENVPAPTLLPSPLPDNRRVAPTHLVNRDDVNSNIESNASLQYVEIRDLPPIPEHLMPRQKETVLRQREAIQAEDLKYIKVYTKERQKQRDLAITRYEIMILAM
jgi:hypothetical protein